ncbi:MAG: tetratricopeptide repeat protein [Chthonomonadales bacterium]
METTESPEYWNKKGSMLGKERAFEEALDCFNRALRMDKEYGAAWYNKALCLKNMERYEQSLRAFHKAVEFNPNDQAVKRKRDEVVDIVASLAPTKLSGRVARGVDNTNPMYFSIVSIIILVVGLVVVWKIVSAVTAPTQFEEKLYSKDANAPITFADTAPDRIEETASTLKRVRTLSPPTGTQIIPTEGDKGKGTLTVTNKSSMDACFKLVSDNADRKWTSFIFVRAGEKMVLGTIQEGKYKLLISQGEQWSASKNEFSKNAVYYMKTDGVKFNEIEIIDPMGGIIPTGQDQKITIAFTGKDTFSRKPLTSVEFEKNTSF